MQLTTPQFDVLVVGGGTAGWLSALALATFLETNDGSVVRVGLCESPAIGTIGVGESTLPTLPTTLSGLGLVEEEWMPTIGATYKLGVRFREWCEPGSGISRSDFWNPVEQVTDQSLIDEWFARRDSIEFSESCGVASALATSALAPRTLDGLLLNEYAYHVDATRLAQVLERKAVERGVVHIVDRVKSVAVSGRDHITAVITEGRGPLVASLYLDCSGFRSVLLGAALHEPWESFADALLTDSAVAIQVPRRKDSIDCYTTARALSSGWAWNVPLVARDGTGYVYSSRYQSADHAEAELREILGRQADGAEARHLTMKVGRSRRSWVGNCVAVGLASGFVEPLEATGIWFIERAIQLLLANIIAGPDPFNDALRQAYDEVRDLIVMHYLVNDRRNTPFWSATKREADVPVSLTDRLRIWKRRPPRRDDFSPSSVFNVTTWTAILDGMGFWGRLGSPDQLNLAPFERVRRRREALLDMAPDHRMALEALAKRVG